MQYKIPLHGRSHHVLGIGPNSVTVHFKKSKDVTYGNPKYCHKHLTISLNVDESCRAAGAVLK